MNKNMISMAVLSSLLFACTPEEKNKNNLPVISQNNIEAHMSFLAADEMRGRNVGTEQYQIAANYLATQYKLLGLKPAGDNGSYFQTVNYSMTSLDADASQFMIAGEALAYGDDFAMRANSKYRDMAVSADEIVFAGYGTAEEVKDLDVKGKVVVVLAGKRAAVSGAKAVISLQTAEHEKQSPFARTAKYYGGTGYGLMSPTGEVMNSRGGETINVALSVSGTAKLINGDVTLDQLVEMTKADDFKPVTIQQTVSLKAVTKENAVVNSPNVIALREGSDPKLKNEIVIISAHLDHIGDHCPKRSNDTSKEGDDICNGALDNSSGISTMLEAARAFVENDVKTKRSIMFVAQSGEEKGLLGARYFAEYPTVDVKNIVADVNLDMPILTYDFANVVAFGSELSTIGLIAEEALAKINVGLAVDPMPEQGLFRRSDHFMFVLKGIPSVFLMSGPDEVGQPAGAGLKKFEGFLNTNYHSPADDMSQDIKMDVAAKFSLANFLIIEAVANADQRPQWYEDNEYGKKYAPDMPRVKAPESVLARIQLAEETKKKRLEELKARQK